MSRCFVPDPASALPTPVFHAGNIFPYTCLRDNTVDIEGIMRICYSVRRHGLGRGWGFPLLPPTETARTFMASQLIVLANTGVYDKAIDDITEITFAGQTGIAHVGSSSFSLFTEATATDPVVAARSVASNGQEKQQQQEQNDGDGEREEACDRIGKPRESQNNDNGRCFVGAQLITLVRIDAETRKPTKIPDEHRARIEEVVSKGHAQQRVQALGLTPLGRLPDHGTIIASCNSSSSSSNGIFRHSISLRALQDFDFNLHANQGSYLRFAVNSVANMTATDDYNRLKSKSGETTTEFKVKVGSPFYNKAWTNSTVRAVRLDYVGEIQDREGNVDVTLFRGESVTAAGRAAVGEKILDAIAPPATTSDSDDTTSKQCVAYFVITMNGDSKYVCNRGFVVFDYTPASLSLSA